MTVVKVAVSLPPEALEVAKDAVRRHEARSVSAYVATAIQEKAEREGLRAVLAEVFTETGGAPTTRERARARGELEAALRDAQARAGVTAAPRLRRGRAR